MFMYTLYKMNQIDMCTFTPAFNLRSNTYLPSNPRDCLPPAARAAAAAD